MSDLRFPKPEPLGIPAGMLDQVVATGVRRRRTALATASGGACLALVLALVIGSSGPGTSTLRPIQPASETPAAAASAAPAPSDSPASGVEQSPDPGPASPTHSPTPLPADSPSPQPSARATGEPELHPWHQPAVIGEAGQDDAIPGDGGFAYSKCDSTSRALLESEDWCVSAYGSYPDGSDELGWFNFWLCRDRDSGDGRVSYDDDQEIDFALRTEEGDDVWTWSTGQDSTMTAHTRTLAPGRCRTWRVSWNGTDDAGRPVAGPVHVVMTPFGSDSVGPLAERFEYEDDPRS